MATQLLVTLVSRTSLRSRMQQAEGCVGKYIGPINLIYHCWEATGSVRELFYSELKQGILQHLDGWFALLSSEDFVILSLYMIGRSEKTASPTICFISESDRYRKEARNVIKESGILKKHPNLKTAHMSKDPGWGAALEQLASSGIPAQTADTKVPAREVFYDPLKGLRPSALPVYVYHDLGTRAATANAFHLRGRIFYLTSAHVLFIDRARPLTPAEGTDSDFEIDSDEESEYEAELNASMTSIGSQSTSSRSSFYPTSESGQDSSSSAIVPVGDIHMSTPPFTEATAFRSLHETRHLTTTPATFASSPHIPSLPNQQSVRSLGKVFDYSTDQDWALIEVHAWVILSFPEPIANLDEFDLELTTLMDTEIIAETAYRTPVHGRLSATPSYIRIPNGTSFQQVYSIRLSGPLFEGDCGSLVINASNGKLFGHIVAGCQSNRFAYVMAAEQVFQELHRSIQNVLYAAHVLQSLPSFLSKDSDGTDLHPQASDVIIPTESKEPVFGDNPQSTKETRTEYGTTLVDLDSFANLGSNPSISAKLVGVSTRVHNVLHDRRVILPAEIEKFAQAFDDFHLSLVELNALQAEFGKPVPFPMRKFLQVLRDCETIIAQLQPQVRPHSMYTTDCDFRDRAQTQEISRLQNQIAGQYQALQMCISFLRLRLNLEATKKAQRLLEDARDQSITKNVLRERASLGSIQEPLQSSAGEFYKDWTVFERWLKAEDARLASDQMINQISPQSSGRVLGQEEGDTASILTLLRQEVEDHLRQEVEDAITVEEHRAKRLASQNRSHLGPGDSTKQADLGMPPPPPLRLYTMETRYSSPIQAAPGDDTGVSFFPPHVPSESPTSPYRTSSVSTNYSSIFTSMSAGSSTSRKSFSTIDTEYEDVTSPHVNEQTTDQLVRSLTGWDLGPNIFEWQSLCRKVQVEREGRSGRETRECDLHWRYREDGGISIRSAYRSKRDNIARSWTVQHFTSLGPGIPLTMTSPDGDVKIEFPKDSFGRLERDLTNILYTVHSTESSNKIRTLLYTNNGKEAADLLYDRPVLTISSNLNRTESRGKNLRLWKHREVHNGTYVDILYILFYANALLERNARWVEEPITAFEWVTDAVHKGRADRLKLVFRRESSSSRWSTTDLFQRKRLDAMEVPAKSHQRVEPVSGITSTLTRTSELHPSFPSSSAATKVPANRTSSGLNSFNRFGYSELEIRFQNSVDRNDFLEIWRRNSDPRMQTTENALEENTHVATSEERGLDTSSSLQHALNPVNMDNDRAGRAGAQEVNSNMLRAGAMAGAVGGSLLGNSNPNILNEFGQPLLSNSSSTKPLTIQRSYDRNETDNQADRQNIQEISPEKQGSGDKSTDSLPKLPLGWIAMWDNTSQKYYYVQIDTGVSQWNLPTDDLAGEQVVQESSPGKQGGGHKSTDSLPKLPSGWIAQWDNTSQKHYYVQTNTGVSQRDLPTQYKYV